MSLFLQRAGLILPPGPSRRYNDTLNLFDGSSGAVGAVATWTPVPIGPASPGRLVVMAVVTGNAPVRKIVSATIGGVAATVHIDEGLAPWNVAFISAVVPTGTTASVVVTFDGNVGTFSLFRVYSYSLYNLLSTTPTDTAFDLSPTAALLSVSIDVAGPAGIIIAAYRPDANTADDTWTGVNEDAEEGLTSAASIQGLGAQTGRTVSVQDAGAVTAAAMAAVSWG